MSESVKSLTRHLNKKSEPASRQNSKKNELVGRTNNFEVYKRQRHKANSPSELIDGLAQYLMQCGYTSSFLDREEADPWKLVTKVMTNPQSNEYRIFWENIEPHIQLSKFYRDERAKRAHRKQRKMRDNLDKVLDRAQPQAHDKAVQFEDSPGPSRHLHAQRSRQQPLDLTPQRYSNLTVPSKEAKSPAQGRAPESLCLRDQIQEKKHELQRVIRQFDRDRKYSSVDRKQIKKIVDLKKTDIEIDEYFEKADFKRNVWNQVQDCPSNSPKYKLKVFRRLFGIKERNGQSPVRDLIRGQNETLLYGQFLKNFGAYRGQFDSQ